MYTWKAGVIPVSHFEGSHELKKEKQGQNLLQISFPFGNTTNPDYKKQKNY